MKRKLSIILLFVLIINFSNSLYVSASEDNVETKTIYSIINPDNGNIRLYSSDSNDKYPKNMFEAQMGNFKDFRVDENLEYLTYDEKRSDFVGVNLKSNQLVPSYFTSLDEKLPENGEISKDRFVEVDKRSFGSKTEDRKLKKGILYDTTDGLFMPFSYPSIATSVGVTQEETKRKETVEKLLDKSLSQIFSKCKQTFNLDSKEDYFKFWEKFSLINNVDGGLLTMNGKTMTIHYGDPNGTIENKTDAKKASQNKENYMADRDKDGNVYMYVWEGSVSKSQVPFGAFHKFIYAVPKGYIAINGINDNKPFISESFNEYPKDSVYLTVNQFTIMALKLYKARNVSTLSKVNLTPETGFMGKIEETVSKWISGLAYKIKPDMDDILTDDLITEDTYSYFKRASLISSIFIIFILMIAVPVMLLRAQNAKKNVSVNISLKQQGSELLKYLAVNIAIIPLFLSSKNIVLVVGEIITNVIPFDFGFNPFGIVDSLLLLLLSIMLWVYKIASLANIYIVMVCIPFLALLTGVELIFKNIFNIEFYKDLLLSLLSIPIYYGLISITFIVIRSSSLTAWEQIPLAFIVLSGASAFLGGFIKFHPFRIFGSLFQIGSTTMGLVAVGAGALSGKHKSKESGNKNTQSNTATSETSASNSGGTTSNSSDMRDITSRNSEKVREKVNQNKKENVFSGMRDKLEQTIEKSPILSQASRDLKGYLDSKTVGAKFGKTMRAVGTGLSIGSDLAGKAIRGSASAISTGARLAQGATDVLGGAVQLDSGQVYRGGERIIDSGEAIAHNTADKVRGMKDYIHKANINKGHRDFLDAGGIWESQFSGTPDNLFATSKVDMDEWRRDGVVNIEKEAKGQYSFTYDVNNLSPDVKHELENIQRYNRAGRMEELKEEMGINSFGGVKVQNPQTGKYETGFIKMTVSANKANKYMNLKSIDIDPKTNKVIEGKSLKDNKGRTYYVPSVSMYEYAKNNGHLNQLIKKL